MNVELNKLGNNERRIVISLAMLPEIAFSVPELMEMFHIEGNAQFDFFDTIHDLSKKGYLCREKALYSLNAEVAYSIIHDKRNNVEDCSQLINYFSAKLENYKIENENDFLPLYQKIQSLLGKANGISFHLAHLSHLLSAKLVQLKKYQDALKYNQLAVDISERIDRKHPSIAIFYRDKAKIHKKLGDNNLSIYYSLKDIEILEMNAGKYDDLLPGSYYSLSKTYEDMHDYEKAIEYNLKAIQFEKKRKPEKSINLSGLYHNLAFYYMKMNNLQNASKFIDKAVEYYLEVKNGNNEQYANLLRDQKRFKSLFKFQKFLLRYKYYILFIVIVLCVILLLAVLKLFV